MPLLVVSPKLPDVPENGFDPRHISLMNKLTPHKPIAYPKRIASRWSSDYPEHLVSDELESDFANPFWDLAAVRNKLNAMVLFDLRRYHGLIPVDAFNFYKFCIRSSNCKLALADGPDHAFIDRMCAYGNVTIKTLLFARVEDFNNHIHSHELTPAMQ